MRILITGGGGYKGVPLAKALLDAGHYVTILDIFVYGYEPVFHLASHPRLNVIKKDIRDPDVSYLKDHDVVMHLAGISGFPACDAAPSSAQAINVDATARIVRNLSKDQILIFASSTSLYGIGLSDTVDEETPVNPKSLYAIHKLKGEEICLEHPNTICLRWATLMGVSPRMRAGLIVQDFTAKAVHERVIVLFSAGSKRTFMHVNDCVDGYVFALDNADRMLGGIYNVGDENLNFSKRDIAMRIRAHTGCEVIESVQEDADVRSFNVSFAKIHNLGYRCKIDLDMTIKELVKLYRFYEPNSFIKIF